MEQGRDGYLWFGSQGGLCRFDGSSFRVYSTGDGLNAVRIRALHEDRDGQLWIGSRDHGLIIYDGEEFRPVTVDSPDIPSPEFIHVITADSRGNIWVGARNGLYRFSDGDFQRFTKEDGLSGTSVWEVFEDTRRNLWVGTFAGLCRFSDGAFEPHVVDPAQPRLYVIGIAEDVAGRLWVGTGKGLFQLKGGVFENVQLPDRPTDLGIRKLTVDSRKDLWVGSRDGAFKRQGDTFVSYGEGQGAGGFIAEIFEDREGNHWFCSRASVAMLPSEAIVSFSTDSPLAGMFIDVVHTRANGDLWAAGEDGVFRVRDETTSVFKIDEGRPNPLFTRIIETQSGALLFGTKGAGVLEFSDGQLSSFDWNDRRGPGNSISDVFEDRDGNIWVSSEKHLFRYGQGEVEVIAQKDGVPEDNYRDTAIVQDHQGTVWFGTRSGIIGYAEGEFTDYAWPDRLKGIEALCLLDEEDGSLWVGTSKGLLRFADGQFSEVTPVDGFSGKIVRTLVRDGRYLYIGMFNGLNRLDLRTMNVRVYTARDGLTHSMIGARGLSKDIQGDLWIGTASGLSCLRPAKDRTNEIPPPVHISRVILRDEELSPYGKTELAYDDNSIKFEFVGLSFTSPEDVRYQYRMKGVNDDWTETFEPSSSFAFLPPGSYSFEVKACNNDNVWSENPATFSFLVHPPYWATLWFRGLMAAQVVRFRDTHSFKVAVVTPRILKHVVRRLEVVHQKERLCAIPIVL
ncbi:MAG: two-component regulator propeller domain-containing protein [Fuerstiella sp.]|nr:two-component regulator propeller domain-containing protein [Fuerstiella sp.]